ncbi:plakophilin-3 isoform X1 [Callorhinchus milii]|uniref:plakophilin-3 isoform X1 n=2 Tax=Callorhinchus milii TaxID=7868 RepID=UPI001C3FBFB3|nr:plakophilin-3 isoform X1 [Callorhinchus milii]
MSLLQDAPFIRSVLPPESFESTLAMPSELQLDQRNEIHQYPERKNIRVQQQVEMMLRANGLPNRELSSSYQTATMPMSKSQIFTTERKYSTIQPPGYHSQHKFPGSSSYSAFDVNIRKTPRASQISRRVDERYRPMSVHIPGPPPSASVRKVTEYRYSQRQPDIDTLSLHSAPPRQVVRRDSWHQSQMNGQFMQPNLQERDVSVMSEQINPSVYYKQMSVGGESGAFRSYSVNYPSVRKANSVSGADMFAMTSQAEDMANTQALYIRPPAQRTLQRVHGKGARERSASSTFSTNRKSMQRAPSLSSLRVPASNMSDIFDGQTQQSQSFTTTQNMISDADRLDLPTAVQLLSSGDVNSQVVGASYIQHKCYHDAGAKKQAYLLRAIPQLIGLFNHPSLEVQRSATAAMRNLIYNNTENKHELVKQNGISQMMQALEETDEELKTNITGILWNLSSNEMLKKSLAQDTLEEVTERILIPLSGWNAGTSVFPNSTEEEIFYNTTGYFRNLSSGREETRGKMRGIKGLVDSLVHYIQQSLDTGKAADKSVENATCILRNLSYRLYEEIPSAYQHRLRGPSRNENDKKEDVVGCFTPQSRKVKEINTDMSVFTEVSKNPQGMEWLWNPAIVKMYKELLDKASVNQLTAEAALGALQNITAGNFRWASVMSRLTTDQDSTWFTIIDQLKGNDPTMMRAATGLLRNLSAHARNKEDISIRTIGPLLSKLPEDSTQPMPHTEVVVNICSVLNNLVVETIQAPKQIVNHNGLKRLMNVKTNLSSGDDKTNKAAASLLANMWFYKSMQREYRAKGYTKRDFQ